MGLAGAAFADEQDRFGALDVAALGQVAHLRRGHIRRLRVIELFQRFHARQMGFPDAALDGVAFPLFDLGQQQCFQISDVAFLLANRLLGQRAELRGDHRHPQSLALRFDGGLLQLRHLVAHRAPPAVRSWSYSSITGSGRAYRSSAPTSMASHVGVPQILGVQQVLDRRGIVATAGQSRFDRLLQLLHAHASATA